MATTDIFNMTDTWTGGGTLSAIKMTVTDTSSAADSMLIDLLVGSTRMFGVRKDGTLMTGGVLPVAGSGSAGAAVRLYEDTDNGTNYVGLKSPDSLSANLTFTMPSADGASGEVLSTNGSGTLSFTSITTVPQNSQSAAYTLVLGDAGKHIFHPSADTTARTWTIPANASVAYPVGTAITFINQNSAGVITIAITSDTMRLAGAGTTGSRTLAANGVATAIKVTSTEWIISGTGLT